MKKLILIAVVFLAACTKVATPPTPLIDLGVKATSTEISYIKQANNIVTAEFKTTVGSKYSVQIIPFGSDEPVIKQGFTADAELVTKIYDLSSLKKMDYDLILTDIKGVEIKYPITKN